MTTPAEVAAAAGPQAINWVAEALKASGTFVLTMFATFVGGWTAFELERRHREDDERRKRLAEGRRAQMTLVAQYTFLKNIDEQLLSEWRGRADSWIQMPPVSAFSVPRALDLSGLEFLLDGADPDLLQQLALAEERVYAVEDLLHKRSSVYGRLQESSAGLSRLGREAQSDEDFVKHVGAHVVAELRDLTAALFRNHSAALVQNADVFRRLRTALRVALPGSKLIAVAALENDAKAEVCG